MTTTIPRITPILSPDELEQFKLVAGDVEPVVDKGRPAFDLITELAARAVVFLDELNASATGIAAACDELAARQSAVTTVIDVNGALRYSQAYFDAITDVVLTTEDVFAGHTLVVRGIAGDQDAPTSERLYPEISVNGPRWGGPILPVKRRRDGADPGDPPTADAGADANVVVGEMFWRDGDGTATGTIAGWEWSVDGQVVSVLRRVEITHDDPGNHALSLVVIDGEGRRSAPDTMALVVRERGVSDGGLDPGQDSLRITRNTDALTRTITSARRSAWLNDAAGLVVSRGAAGAATVATHDIIAADGRVLAHGLRTGVEAIASYTSPRHVYGIRDFGSGMDLCRSNWTSGSLFVYFNSRGPMTIGDGHGRQSDDDGYLVVRRTVGNTLVCVDLQGSGELVGVMPTPDGHLWASITPSGDHVLVAETGGIYRYERNFTGRTRISPRLDDGDCATGADGRVYFVQGGVAPRIVDVASGTTTLIDTDGQAATGTVSGASILPGHVAVCWRVGGTHEVATLALSDGAAAWTQRTSWDPLDQRAESRAWATPAAVLSPSGRALVYRAPSAPGSSGIDLHLLS